MIIRYKLKKRKKSVCISLSVTKVTTSNAINKLYYGTEAVHIECRIIIYTIIQ